MSSLATENHVVDVTLSTKSEEVAEEKAEGRQTNNTTSTAEGMGVKSWKIPKDGPSWICVGQSSSHGSVVVDNDEQLPNGNRGIQAITLMDPTALSPTELSELEPQQRPLYHPPRKSQDTVALQHQQQQDDNQSVASVGSMSKTAPSSSKRLSQTASSPSLHRSGSSLSLVEADTTVPAVTSAFVTSAQVSTGKGSSAVPSVATEPESSTTVVHVPSKTIGRLVVRVESNTLADHVQNAQNVKYDKHGNVADIYITSLDFKPLAQHVMEFSENWEGAPPFGVWVGSANDAKLRFYIPPSSSQEVLQSKSSAKQVSPLTLYEFTDSHAGMIFLSPITAISGRGRIPHDGSSMLAVACLDGTIRIQTWHAGGCFRNMSSTSVIVDGPISSLHLHMCNHAHESEIQVVAGSLCGYACRMVRSFVKTDSPKVCQQPTWDGPFMVAQGFWDVALEAEDSVLAVHGFGGHVLIGTHCGRVALYRCPEYGQHDMKLRCRIRRSSYQLIWQSVLPYSIHGICHDARSLEGNLQLLITTRRSIHVFKQQTPVTTSVDDSKPDLLPTVSYCAALVKSRLQETIERRRQEEAVNKSVETTKSQPVILNLTDDARPASNATNGVPAHIAMDEDGLQPEELPDNAVAKTAKNSSETSTIPVEDKSEEPFQMLDYPADDILMGENFLEDGKLEHLPVEIPDADHDGVGAVSDMVVNRASSAGSVETTWEAIAKT